MNAFHEESFWNDASDADIHGDPPYDVEPVARRLSGAVRQGGRILDVGCGRGRLTNYLALSRPDTEIVGFDISSSNITAARRGAPGNATYHKGGGRSVPSRIEGGFDLAYSVAVLQHIPHDVKAKYIGQVYDLLNPGSSFVFTIALGDLSGPFNYQMGVHEAVDMIGGATEGRAVGWGVETTPDLFGWFWGYAAKGNP